MIDQNQIPSIDKNFYLRQILVLGVDAMKKLATGSVLISGMGGLGVEIAKNIILSGVKCVTIHDTKNTELNDLASNFYLTEKSIGKNRAIESLHQLSSLNEYVTVNAKTEDLTNNFIKNYNCVVIADYHSETDIKKISKFCHENDIKLIITEARGLFAYIFTDFGKNFVVTDPDGEPPSRFLLNFVTNSENGRVTIDQHSMHDLVDGDHVIFEEVEGMTELNGKEFEVKVIDIKHFTIGDTRNFGKYTSKHRSGYGNKVILPKKYEFLELTDALKNPKTMEMIFDYCTFGQDQQVILSFIAAQHHLDKSHKTTPEVSGDELLESAKEVNSIYKIVDEIDENLIREFARESGSVINPTCAIFGGIASQEVIKSITCKFGPIHQFLAMCYTSSLPKDTSYEIKNDRYDPYRIVFGNKQQETMQRLRYFLVGAGSIGCEHLKNFALMGVATKDEGQIVVTDMDSIKRSNLNNHFLFRNKDIDKMKSAVATDSVKSINSTVNIIPHQNKVDNESRNIYSDKFFEQLDGVCIAVDNDESCSYVDSLCVFYNKPLLESGKIGTKSHYQTIVPHITEDCNDSQNCQTYDVDLSTAFNFPSTGNHLYIWVNNQYNNLFIASPQSIANIINDHDYIEKNKKNDEYLLSKSLISTKKFFIDEKCESFNDCIKWARLKFEEFFDFNIRTLISKFPEDHLTYEGTPFWTGYLRFPTPATFDPNNQLHAQFVKSAALIRSRVCGIEPEKVDVPQIASKFEISEKEVDCYETIAGLNLDEAIQENLPLIEKARQNHKIPNPEKEYIGGDGDDDDGTNLAFDFIYSAINIRAINYKLKTLDEFEVKKIAFKICPSIITTSAVISGLVALEMYKIHCVEKDKKINDFRFGYINLAIPAFFISEPRPCKYVECSANKIKFSIWDKWIIEGDLTIGQIIKEIKKKYNVDVEMIFVGRRIIYSSFNDSEEKRKLLNRNLKDYVMNDLNLPIYDDQYYFSLDCCCFADNDDDIDNPQVCLKFK